MATAHFASRDACAHIVRRIGESRSDPLNQSGRINLENAMSVAKIIELNSASSKNIEDAVQTGLTKCSESVKNIKGAWVNEIKVVTSDDGKVTEWRVNLRVTFIVK
jgi:flavin-binding protein dodecin